MNQNQIETQVAQLFPYNTKPHTVKLLNYGWVQINSAGCEHNIHSTQLQKLVG